jgi:N-acetyl-gamma-glutamyl-phosphate reductase
MPETVAYSRLTRRPIFVPSVGHFRQGMLVSIPLHTALLPGAPSGAAFHSVLAAHYAGSENVRVRPAGGEGRLEAEALNDTDILEIGVYPNDARGHAVLVARLDNLGKGASGAAVQNIRLMLGLPAHATGRASVDA